MAFAHGHALLIGVGTYKEYPAMKVPRAIGPINSFPNKRFNPSTKPI